MLESLSLAVWQDAGDELALFRFPVTVAMGFVAAFGSVGPISNSQVGDL